MKKEIIATLSALMIIATPITGYANIHNTEKFNKLPVIYQDALRQIDDIHIMYTNTRVNVRAGADTKADIICTVEKNTPIDVFVDNVGGWAIVTLGENDFYSFIKSEYLSPTETRCNYTEDDLYVLSHIIDAEMGVESWEDKLYSGSVVLNRVNGDKWWGNTIREVVFKRGQYQPTWSGTFYRQPSQESINAAIYLLENGSVIPSNVVYQAEFKQGRIWKKTKAAYYCYG